MLVMCSNCGKEILTEADTFIYQHRYDGDYYSCGCAEGVNFNKTKAFSEGWLQRQFDLADKEISIWSKTKRDVMMVS